MIICISKNSNYSSTMPAHLTTGKAIIHTLSTDKNKKFPLQVNHNGNFISVNQAFIAQMDWTILYETSR